MTQEKEHPTPPYVAWSTLKTFVSHLREVPAPPTHIDRGVWSRWVPGGVGPQLITGLRYLGLLNDEAGVTDEFSAILHAKDEDAVKTSLRHRIESAYAPVFGNLPLDRATPIQIEEKFEAYGVSGDVKRKCIAFFVAAAQDLGIPLSTFVQDRARVRRGRKPKKDKVMIRKNGWTPSPLNEPQTPAKPTGTPLQIVADHLPLIFDPGDMDESVQQAWVKLFTWVKTKQSK